MATKARSRVTPTAVLERLWKRYPDGTVALRDIDLQIGAGERVLVTGPPGSGTSTLLRILSGRSLPTGGSARILGVAAHFADHRSICKLRSRVALLDGTLHLPQEATAREAIEVAATQAIRRPRRPSDLLEGLGHLPLDRRVGDLAMVERAVLSLAVAAARRTHLIVADDPWRNLDPGQGLFMGRMACRIATDLGAAFVLAGRDAGAFDGIDRAFRLRDGRLVAGGS